VTVNLLQLSGLARPLSTKLPPPLPLCSSAAAARQQQRRGAKMVNSDWQVLWVGSLDTWEITRIVASNTARIGLPMSLQLEPYRKGATSNSRKSDGMDKQSVGGRGPRGRPAI